MSARLAVLGALVISSFGSRPSSAPDPVRRETAEASRSLGASLPAVDARFAETIGRASEYAKWGRVDEEPRAAPTDCIMPVGSVDGTPSQVRLSAADDGPHGDKLYYLWATDRRAYLTNRATAVGFTIVKESFRAEPASGVAERAPQAEATYSAPPSPIRTLRVGDRLLQAGAPNGLFVIAKVAEPDAAGTDAGWIYGTIATDGAVTSAGRVASCMGCHEDATHERLFGLQ